MSLWKKGLLLAGDAALLYAALAVALLIRYGAGEFSASFAVHLLPFSVIFIAWILTFYLSDLYHLKSFSTPAILVRNLSLATAIAAGFSVALFYLFSGFFELTPKTNLAIFASLVLILTYGWRVFLRSRFRAAAVPVLFAGSSPRLDETVALVTCSPHLGYRVAGHMRKLEGAGGSALEHLINGTDAGLIVIEPHLARDPATLEHLYRTLSLGVNVIPLSEFYELVFEKVPLEDLSEEWFIENISTRRPFYDRVKRLLDVGLGAALAIILSPFMILATLGILLSSPGPVIYAQKRVGKNGKVFTLYKFRTMRHNTSGALWTEANDARITPIGKLLRFAHVDEFPQLWNIVRGDISFTGPRPERMELVHAYEKFPYYEMRHVVKPGLTGWAQINYRPSASLEEAYEKLKYDLYYVKNRSLFLDLLIIIKTIRHLFVSFTA